MRKSWIALIMSLLGSGFGHAFAQYCLPEYQFSCATDMINQVSLGSINNTNSGCTGTLPNNYTDFSGTYSTNLFQGLAYGITVNSSIDYSQFFAVFIDFNQDNDFDDPDEYFNLGQNTGAGVALTGSITIPVAALPGSTTMRVMCWWNNNIPQDSVCSPNLGYGEVEEYEVVILPPPSLEGRLVDITAPVTNCPLSSAEPVIFAVANGGSDTISGFNACFVPDGGPPFCESFSNVIPPGDTVDISFLSTVNLGTPGTYTIDGWIEVAGDPAPYNDSIIGYTVTHLTSVSSFPYIQGFETDNGDFTTEGNNPSWEHGTPAGIYIPSAASGTQAWVTNLTGDYSGEEEAYLVSPCFDFSGMTSDPVLRFAHIFETEGICCVFGWVDVSTDAGSTWIRLGAGLPGLNWYNDSTEHAWSVTSGDSAIWRPASMLLNGMAGESQFRLRFAMTTPESPVFREGFGVDDIQIREDSLHDISLNEFVSPGPCPNDSLQEISVEIGNYGTDTLFGLELCYSLNGGSVICDSIPDTLAPFTELVYTFSTTANFSTAIAYDLEVFISHPGDLEPANDTLSLHIDPRIVTFPYLQTFDTWPVVTANPTPLRDGWINSETDDGQDWWINDGPTLSVGTGPAADHTSGSGNYLYLEDSDPFDNEAVDLMSPCFDLTNFYACANFWVHSNNANGSDSLTENFVILEIFDGSIWTPLDTLKHLGNSWVNVEYNLIPWYGQIVRLRFRGNNNNQAFSHDIAIDDFSIVEKVPLNAGILGFNSPPLSSCGLGASEMVCVEMVNAGFDTLYGPIPVFYALGADTISEFFTDTLAPAESIEFCFSATADFSVIGMYDLVAWVELAGDSVSGNDTLSQMVENIPLINTFPYFEDFESGPASWTSGGTLNSWEFGTPAKNTIVGAASGVNSWVTGGLDTLMYNNNENSYVFGPCFDFTTLSSELWITMKIWWNAEFSWDGAVLQSSVDGGDTWQNIGTLGAPYNWYNDNSISGNPGGQQIGWTGRTGTGNGSNGWVCAWHPIPSSLAGAPDVFIRVAFGADGSVVDDGFAFDDIGIGLPPPLMIDLGADTVACGELMLDVGPGGAFYIWSTGDSASTTMIDTTSLVFVELIDSNGCPFTDSIYVTINPSPDVNLGHDTVLCSTDTLCLSAGTDSSAVYSWSTGDSTSGVCIEASGNYSVTVSNMNGCSTSDTLDAVIGVMAPEADFVVDDSECPFMQLFDESLHDPDSWSWNFGDGSGANGPDTVHTYAFNGTFVVTLTVENECGWDTSQKTLLITCVGTEGVEEFIENAFQIWPNPNNGAFDIQMIQAPGPFVEVSMLDMKGSRVFSQQFETRTSGQIIRVESGAFVPGLYLVQVRYKDKISSKRSRFWVFDMIGYLNNFPFRIQFLVDIENLYN